MPDEGSRDKVLERVHVKSWPRDPGWQRQERSHSTEPVTTGNISKASVPATPGHTQDNVQSWGEVGQGYLLWVTS